MCLGYLIGRQLYPTFAGIEDSLKIVFETLTFCGLSCVIAVEGLADEDGTKYFFQASALRAAKFGCIVHQDERAFAVWAAFQSNIVCGNRLGV